MSHSNPREIAFKNLRGTIRAAYDSLRATSADTATTIFYAASTTTSTATGVIFRQKQSSPPGLVVVQSEVSSGGVGWGVGTLHFVAGDGYVYHWKREFGVIPAGQRELSGFTTGQTEMKERAGWKEGRDAECRVIFLGLEVDGERLAFPGGRGKED